MTRTTRPLSALALIATTVTISACGSSAPAETGTDGSPANNTATDHRTAVRFAECMRSHGVSAFPDPDVLGKLTIDAAANGSSLNPSAPAFTQALHACKALQPPGFTGGTRSPEQQRAGLKFAACVRRTGVPDFPDPAVGQPLVDTNRIPSAASASGMSILNAAMHKCRDAAAAAGVTR